MQTRKQKVIPRGLRNNNPLNIRIGNTWLGEREHPTDGEFEEFVTLAYGLRAAFIILRRYIRRYHLNTVRLIVERWAPRNENETEKYIQFVCQDTGLMPNTTIQYEDEKTMCKLVGAMAFIECGQRIQVSEIVKGYSLA